MKKIIYCTLIMFIACLNVDAKEYEFVDYVTKKIDGDFKYEEVIMHRYYKEHKVYDGYYENNENNSLLREDDNYILAYDYTYKYKDPMQKLSKTYKVKDDNKTDNIVLENFTFSSQKITIEEVELYYNGELINYSVKNGPFLNDGNKESGGRWNYTNYILNLEHEYDLSGLSIVFYYLNQSSGYWTVDIKAGDFVTGYCFNNSVLDYNIGILNFLKESEFNKLKVDNEPIDNEIKEIGLLSAYLNIHKLYSYYHLEREYIENSPLDSIEGLKYDCDEDYIIYKQYKPVEDKTTYIAPKTGINSNYIYNLIASVFICIYTFIQMIRI